MLFFELSTWMLALVLAVVIVGATVVGHLVGRSTREHEHVREPFAVMQGALIGFMGLVLAFGISLAVGRYEARRAAVVDEANAIGTTYLRAQNLTEPVRTESLALLQRLNRHQHHADRYPARQLRATTGRRRERAGRAPTMGTGRAGPRRSSGSERAAALRREPQ